VGELLDEMCQAPRMNTSPGQAEIQVCPLIVLPSLWKVIVICNWRRQIRYAHVPLKSPLVVVLIIVRVDMGANSGILKTKLQLLNDFILFSKLKVLALNYIVLALNQIILPDQFLIQRF